MKFDLYQHKHKASFDAVEAGTQRDLVQTHILVGTKRVEDIVKDAFPIWVSRKNDYLIQGCNKLAAKVVEAISGREFFIPLSAMARQDVDFEKYLQEEQLELEKLSKSIS